MNEIENQEVEELLKCAVVAQPIYPSEFKTGFVQHEVHAMVHRSNLRCAPNVMIVNPLLWEKIVPHSPKYLGRMVRIS